MDVEAGKIAAAEALFLDGKFAKSAGLFATSSLPVEEVLLRFVSLEEPAALKELLMTRLEHTPDHETTQITILAFWLIEHVMQSLEGTPDSEGRDLLRAELRSLLSERKVVKCFDDNAIRGKVYDLLASFGEDDIFLYFARETRDYEVLVDHCVKRGLYEDAIRVLLDCNQANLVYCHLDVLLRHCPRQTIRLMIDMRSVDPLKVLPSLLQNLSTKQHSSHVMQYLEHQVHVVKSHEKVLLSHLLVLYAEYEPKKLTAFLECESNEALPFDEMFVLRVAEQLQLHVACVKLLQRMGLFQEALDRALDVSLTLAKDVARDPRHEEHFRKKLWLKIAEKVVSDGESFADFVKESDAIAVPDLLPLLPDFQTISFLKKAVCATLQDYTSVLEGVKEEMSEAAENLQDTKEDLKEWRKECVLVSSGSACSLCSEHLHLSSFYAFPCQHLFHSRCLPSDTQECPFCGHAMVELIGQPLPSTHSTL